MVIPVTLRLDELFRQGKDFKWDRPCACPKCEGKLWGHGWTSRYFQGFSSAFWLRRYRCTKCRVVITLRPAGFWPRLQTCIEQIYQILRQRLASYRWPAGMNRQRAGHWLRGFHLKLRFHPEWSIPDASLVQALDLAMGSGIRFV